MHTDIIFDMAELPVRAAAIRRGGRTWLLANRKMVEHWAREAAIDIAVALSIDLAEFCPEPPADPITVDVVVPFCAADREFLRECLEGLNSQKHVNVIAHVVSDQSTCPKLPSLRNLDLRQYETAEQSGPYRIANSLVAAGHVTTGWLAIQDGDDISRPDRLWRQLQILIASGADMISSAARNFITPGQEHLELLQRKVKRQPVVTPGKKTEFVPLGYCVNPARLMRVDRFVRLNGFSPMPCSGDSDLDNRWRFSGGDVIDDPTILVDRRVHGGSLSHGVHPWMSAVRRRELKTLTDRIAGLRKKPTVEFAAQFGGLNHASLLRVL